MTNLANLWLLLPFEIFNATFSTISFPSAHLTATVGAFAFQVEQVSQRFFFRASHAS